MTFVNNPQSARSIAVDLMSSLTPTEKKRLFKEGARVMFVESIDGFREMVEFGLATSAALSLEVAKQIPSVDEVLVELDKLHKEGLQ